MKLGVKERGRSEEGEGGRAAEGRWGRTAAPPSNSIITATPFSEEFRFT